MRRSTPKADQENVITVYGDSDSRMQRVGFKDARMAYPILIDRSGKVVSRHTGNLDEETYDAISSQVVKLLDSK